MYWNSKLAYKLATHVNKKSRNVKVSVSVFWQLVTKVTPKFTLKQIFNGGTILAFNHTCIERISFICIIACVSPWPLKAFNHMHWKNKFHRNHCTRVPVNIKQIAFNHMHLKNKFHRDHCTRVLVNIERDSVHNQSK